MTPWLPRMHEPYLISLMIYDQKEDFYAKRTIKNQIDKVTMRPSVCYTDAITIYTMIPIGGNKTLNP